MVTDDIAELTQNMVSAQAASFPTLPIFYDGQDEEPDETRIWCRFFVNPDIAVPGSISTAGIQDQQGLAVLQIMQPRALKITAGQLDRWDIAELTGKAFKGFRGPAHKIVIKSITSQRNPDLDPLYHIVNVIIGWRSRRQN